MSDASTLFELLTAKSRRRLLVTLCDVESIQVPDDLSMRGATQAASSSGSQSLNKHSPDELSPYDIQMYHNHLPKLQAEDVIEWDRETGTVARGPAFERVEPAVRLLATNQHALPGEFF